MKIHKLTLAALSLSALSINSIQASELAYLYKDQRMMAMGGANVSVGGYSTSLFSNPAGIAKVSNEHGVVVELLGIQASISADSEEMFNDINDAIDSEDLQTIKDELQSHAGKTTHVDLSNYSSITNNHGDFAWSLGFLSAVDVNLRANEDDTLSVQARGYSGITGAATYTFEPSDLGDLSLGLGLKIIAQQSYTDTWTADELIEFDDLVDEIEDDLQDDGTAVGVDIGAIYQFNTALSPAIGLSVLNVGDLDFDGHYGSQPMTVNIGASIHPEISFLKKTVIAVDYVDLLNENKSIEYLPSEGSADLESDYLDSIDHLRIGASALIYENSWSAFELSTGLYHSAYTAGLTFTAGILRIGGTTYEEKLSSSYSDRRYNLSMGIVW